MTQSQEQFEGKWHQLKGQAKQRWAKLTDDDFEQMSGKTEELVGKLQERYGETKEWAENQVESFKRRLNS